MSSESPLHEEKQWRQSLLIAHKELSSRQSHVKDIFALWGRMEQVMKRSRSIKNAKEEEQKDVRVRRNTRDTSKSFFNPRPLTPPPDPTPEDDRIETFPPMSFSLPNSPSPYLISRQFPTDETLPAERTT